jgi:hypothetical protein
MFNNINKLVPIINLVISSTALGFQIRVLYPWHNDLDKKFNDLDKKIDNLIK